VIIVDDDPHVRAALALMLGGQSEIEVVGQAGDGEAGVALSRAVAPDVVLMDIRTPGLNGLEATRSLNGGAPSPKVIVLTTFDADEFVLRALRAGASGFLLKDTHPAKLLEAVEVVASGDALLAPRVTRRLIEQFLAQPAPAAYRADDGLTDREREVLVAVAHGLSNQEIAVRLHMGYGTVKTHVSHLLTKLGCRDRAQLVMAAYESGLTVPGRA
jgi:DNA-binding NarL/FixJ family response regulator